MPNMWLAKQRKLESEKLKELFETKSCRSFWSLFSSMILLWSGRLLEEAIRNAKKTPQGRSTSGEGRVSRSSQILKRILTLQTESFHFTAKDFLYFLGGEDSDGRGGRGLFKGAIGTGEI